MLLFVLPESISARLCLSGPPGWRPPPWSRCHQGNRSLRPQFFLYFVCLSRPFLECCIFIYRWVIMSHYCIDLFRPSWMKTPSIFVRIRASRKAFSCGQLQGFPDVGRDLRRTVVNAAGGGGDARFVGPHVGAWLSLHCWLWGRGCLPRLVPPR